MYIPLEYSFWWQAFPSGSVADATVPYLTIWFMSAFFSLKSLDKYQETKGLVISREEKQEMKPDLHKMWELPDFIWRRKKRDFFFLNPKFYMQSGKSLGFGGHFLI